MVRYILTPTDVKFIRMMPSHLAFYYNWQILKERLHINIKEQIAKKIL